MWRAGQIASRMPGARGVVQAVVGRPAVARRSFKAPRLAVSTVFRSGLSSVLDQPCSLRRHLVGSERMHDAERGGLDKRV